MNKEPKFSLMQVIGIVSVICGAVIGVSFSAGMTYYKIQDHDKRISGLEESRKSMWSQIGHLNK